MDASLKASFKFIFIQHFVLIEQARTRDSTEKRPLCNPLTPWRGTPRNTPSICIWARHCGSWNWKVTQSPTYRNSWWAGKGRGVPWPTVADLCISHWNIKSTFHNLWKPLLCCVTPAMRLLKITSSHLDCSCSSKGRQALWLSHPAWYQGSSCILSLPAPHQQCCSSGIRQLRTIYGAIAAIFTPLFTRCSRQIMAIKPNFQRHHVCREEP